MANLAFQTGQVRGSSDGRNVEIDFSASGFKAETTAYVTLVGWNFQFQNPDHHIHEIGIWTKKMVPGGYEWSNEFLVDSGGKVHGRFFVLFNDDSDDDPFNCLINYLAIGEAP